MFRFRGFHFLAGGLVLAIGSTLVAGQTQERSGSEERVDRPLTEVRLASELTDADVIGVGNEKIGDVDDWVMDRDGRPIYVIVGEGGVLGIGQELVAVPARAAKVGYVQDRGWTVSIEMSKEQLENAPKIGDNFRQLIDPQWYRKNAIYFGLDENRAAAEEVPSTMIRLDEVIGSDVHDASAEKIADVRDVILDEDFRPAYMILGAGGFLGIGEDKIPVPYQNLSIGYDPNQNQSQVTINMTKDQLERAPRIENNNFRVLLNAETQQRVNQYFNTPTSTNR